MFQQTTRSSQTQRSWRFFNHIYQRQTAVKQESILEKIKPMGIFTSHSHLRLFFIVHFAKIAQDFRHSWNDTDVQLMLANERLYLYSLRAFAKGNQNFVSWEKPIIILISIPHKFCGIFYFRLKCTYVKNASGLSRQIANCAQPYLFWIEHNFVKYEAPRHFVMKPTRVAAASYVQ